MQQDRHQSEDQHQRPVQLACDLLHREDTSEALILDLILDLFLDLILDLILDCMLRAVGPPSVSELSDDQMNILKSTSVSGGA